MALYGVTALSVLVSYSIMRYQMKNVIDFQFIEQSKGLTKIFVFVVIFYTFAALCLILKMTL